MRWQYQLVCIIECRTEVESSRDVAISVSACMYHWINHKRMIIPWLPWTATQSRSAEIKLIMRLLLLYTRIVCLVMVSRFTIGYPEPWYPIQRDRAVISHTVCRATPRPAVWLCIYCAHASRSGGIWGATGAQFASPITASNPIGHSSGRDRPRELYGGVGDPVA